MLTHHGVTHVILFMGTNDVRRDASAAQVIAGMQDVIRRVKAKGLKIVGVTMIPRHNRPPAENNTGWNAAKTQIRNEVNQWIRTRAPFDAVIDFDKVVQDSEERRHDRPAVQLRGRHSSEPARVLRNGSIGAARHLQVG